MTRRSRNWRPRRVKVETSVGIGTIALSQVRAHPLSNGRPFKNHRAFISTRNALPASVYKHPGIYKWSANMTGQLYILFHKTAIFS